MRVPQIKNVLFYGTDTFSTEILRGLHKNDHNVLVVTKSDVTPVFKYCKKHGLPVDFYKKRYPPFMKNRDSLSKFMGVVASFGYLLPEQVINLPGQGFVNVHPSKIPQYRGAAPIHHTLLNGDVYSGITILDVLPKRFDAGDILHQVDMEVPLSATGHEIWNMISRRSSQVLLEYLADPSAFHPRPQGSTGACSAPRIPPNQIKNLSYVCPQLQTAQQIYNIYRLVDKGVWVSWNNRRLKLKTIKLGCSSESHIKDFGVGEFRYNHHSKNLTLKCLDGYLEVSRIILPDSGTSSDGMTPERFWTGHSHRNYKIFTMFYKSEFNNNRCFFSNQRKCCKVEQSVLKGFTGNTEHEMLGEL